MILKLGIGALNIVLSKNICERLTPYEISQWRYLFAIVQYYHFALYNRTIIKDFTFEIIFFLWFKFFFSYIFMGKV